MGKFLKIIRYIAKTYKAIMGNCISLQKRGNDFIPDQDVSSRREHEHEQKLTFLSSHVYSQCSEFWGNQTQITDSCWSGKTGCLILKGIGCIPGTVDNSVENMFWILDSANYPDSSTRIERTKHGFVIQFGAKSGILENFEIFLRQEITEGDFKEGLVLKNPENYSEIWEILTSGSAFFAIYTLNR